MYLKAIETRDWYIGPNKNGKSIYVSLDTRVIYETTPAWDSMWGLAIKTGASYLPFRALTNVDYLVERYIKKRKLKKLEVL